MLVTPTHADGVTILMRDLGRSYVRYFNDTYRRSGTLWEGRFKSSLIDSERYCLACYRYIEMNPVRAMIVSRPGEYPWSSYHFNALGEDSDLITPHEQWMALGMDQYSRQKAYRDLFTELLTQEEVKSIRYGTRKCLPVGDVRFKQHVEEVLGIKLGSGKRGRRW
jgi:putative transposase